MTEKGLFYWYGASCVLLSLGQSWHRTVWLINLLDWNSQNIRKPCPLLPLCDSFDETASWDPEGAREAVTYVFNYKHIPFHKVLYLSVLFAWTWSCFICHNQAQNLMGVLVMYLLQVCSLSSNLWVKSDGWADIVFFVLFCACLAFFSYFPSN